MRAPKRSTGVVGYRSLSRADGAHRCQDLGREASFTATGWNFGRNFAQSAVMYRIFVLSSPAHTSFTATANAAFAISTT
jgi:hypothetical protein